MTTQFGRDVADRLAKVAGRRRMSELFALFVEIVHLSARNGTEPRNASWEERERRFHEIRGIVGDDAVREFSAIAGTMMVEAMRRHGDLLGEIHGALGLGRQHLAQHFTPYAVSRTMASMAIGARRAEIEKRRVLAVLEPASGSGGMVVAAHEAVLEMGMDPIAVLRVTARDVDPLCWRMTFVACWLYAIPATVILGDTLADEKREVVMSPGLVRALAAGHPAG